MVELVESKADFARRLNVSRQHVQRLVADGLPLDQSGAVRVDAALRWVRENVRAKPGRPEGSTGNAENADLGAAKVRLLLAQAEKAEIDIAKSRGELLPSPVASKVVRAFTRVHRDHMLNFANRHGAGIAATIGASAAATIAAIEAAMREHMNELADTPMPFEGEIKDAET